MILITYEYEKMIQNDSEKLYPFDHACIAEACFRSLSVIDVSFSASLIIFSIDCFRFSSFQMFVPVPVSSRPFDNTCPITIAKTYTGFTIYYDKPFVTQIPLFRNELIPQM